MDTTEWLNTKPPSFVALLGNPKKLIYQSFPERYILFSYLSAIFIDCLLLQGVSYTGLRALSLSQYIFLLFMGFSRQEHWGGLPFPSPGDHVLSELFPMSCPSWVALQSTAHNLIELDMSCRAAQDGAPALLQSTAARTSSGDTQPRFCQSLWGLWLLVHTRFVWARWASREGTGFASKCDFAPLLSCWGFFFALGRGVSDHSFSSASRPLLQRLLSC